METRARYVLVGAFTLAVIAAAFAFVYWLNTTGGLRERAFYRIRYQNSVSGLLVGSAVLFNGVRVGRWSRSTSTLKAARDHGDHRCRARHASRPRYESRDRFSGT